jgi:glycosyltransferase involved in cell wall biosynthesis
MNGVVMLVNEFPPLPVGGAETQAERLSTYLAENDWKVWVLTRHTKGLLTLEERNGFTIVRPATWGIGKIQTITFLISTIITLYKMRKQYQILHAHLAFGPAFVATLMGKLLNKKVIVKLGGSNAIGDIQASMKTWRGRIRLNAIRKWADVIIALTNVMRDEAIQAGIPASRIRLIDNGIDSQSYKSSTLEKEKAKKIINSEDNTLILFVGRLDPVKSLPTIIEAMKIAITTQPTLKLIIVGDGPQKRSLEKLVNALSLHDYVEFTGNKTDIKAYLQASDIFVLPSLTEGISNALLEAMASSIACVATPVGGNLEVLENAKYGLMPPVGDVQAWAQVLIDLGSNENLRRQFGEKAKERILTKYDFNVVGNRYIKLYSELISEKSR